MPRYIAFLRAINVGGHTVKMDHLRQIFELLGFANVETFIASGNVVFETAALDTAALETQIASALQVALGFEVATFIRTETELAHIAAHKAFPPSDLDGPQALNIAFLAAPLDAEAVRKLMALKTAIDDFATREARDLLAVPQEAERIHLLQCRPRKDPRQAINSSRANTVQKMAAKYAASG